MKRAMAVYLAISLVMLAVILGFPFKILPERPSAGLVTPQGAEVVAKSAVDPAPVPTAAAPAAAPAAVQGSTAAALTAMLAKPVVRGGDAGLDEATTAILSDLSMLPGSAQTADPAGLRAMSTAALTGLRALRGQPAAAAPTLETLVSNALRDGQTDAYINTLVNEAAGKGEISVPSALITSDGRVDTAVLMSSLVTKAQVAAGNTSQPRPEDVVAGGAGVEVRMVNKAIGAAESHQFYTVLLGDSLGSIALKFYGNVSYYPAIFNANRALLSSPDKLKVGQRLVVPSPEQL
jgi:nucleoid-associated protein YgaU